MVLKSRKSFRTASDLELEALRVLEPVPVENQVFTRLDARHGTNGGHEVRASGNYKAANGVAGLVAAVDDAFHLRLQKKHDLR